MRIQLPSKGIHGQSVVETRVPTFKDLYDIQDNSSDDIVQKFTFVKLVTNCDFSKVTYDDVIYIFTLLSFALLNNSMKYPHTCSKCENEYEHIINLGDQNIIQLQLDKKNIPFSKRIKRKKYQYTIPTAQQILDAYDKSRYEEDEDRAYLDLQVAAIMNHPGDRDYAKTVPVSVYAAALVFQELSYHGIDTRYKSVCPKCGNTEDFRFSVSSEVLKLDRDSIISRYVSVQDKMSFTDFMSMSIRAFNTFVTELNKKDGK